MKNPPAELAIRQISSTFGVALTAEGRVVLVQLEDGKITDLVETAYVDLYRAYMQVQTALQQADALRMEARTTKPN